MDDGDISWTEVAVGNIEPTEERIGYDKWEFKGHHLINGKSEDIITFKRQ